jgi:hypothetical protein
MTFAEPILEVREVKRDGVPRMGDSPKCLIVEVRTATTRGEFVELKIAENAASVLAAKLADYSDGGHQNTRSLEGELEEHAND